MERIAIIDVDGVLKREKLILPGVPEFFRALTAAKIAHVVLSNNSRQNSSGLLQAIQKMGVKDLHEKQALTSADATAMWMVEHPSVDPAQVLVWVVGQAGIRTALQERGIKLADAEWDGKKWKTVPTDVVVGFDDAVTYESFAPAFNALVQGARFIGTNPDASYRNEEGTELPANGAALNYLRTSGKEPMIIGKPQIGMAEIGLQRIGAKKDTHEVMVVGDTFDQDCALAVNLRAAGWTVKFYLVLSGVVQKEQITGYEPVDGVFADIQEITAKL